MARWYIIHAYSGFENKVRDQILSEAERKGLSALVESVEVPTEQVTEVRRGKKVKAERKFFPGYVLAKLNMNDDVYHLVKNTPKVTGFLGANNKPQPITEAEAARILNTKEELAAAPGDAISGAVASGSCAQEARFGRLRNRRSGEGDERPVRQLQRRGRGTGFRQEPRQGFGLDLRSCDASRTRFRRSRIDEIMAAIGHISQATKMAMRS